MKIAFFSTKSYDRDYFIKYNGYQHDLTFYETRLNEDTAILAEGHDGVCVFVHDELTRDVLEILKQHQIKLVLLRCAGFNNVDLQAARDMDIKVYRVPAYSPHAVAEHASALIMALNRKIHKAYNRVRDLNFSLDRLTGFDLFEKTVGVIGTGKIGEAFCHIMLGYGCRVVAFDKYPNIKLEAKGIEYVTLNECLERSDIISLHCPLTDETKHLINKERIKKMKKGVMLINTSRGGLVNTQDVIKALKKQKIGYLGIDVYEQEENLFFEDFSETIIEDEMINRLITFPNVLITSHQGFLTRDALMEITHVTYENIELFLNNRPTDNELII